MEISQICQRLEEFIRSKFRIGPNDPDFNQDVHLFDYGYVDSFGAVEIIKFVDQTFGVKITDKDLVVHQLNTIQEIATLVQGRVPK